MNLTPLALLAALALLVARPLAAQGGGPEDDWILIDGVAAQAGDEIITMRALDRAVREEVERRFGDEPISEPTEVDRISWERLERMVIENLEAQAGADMGVDPAQVQHMINTNLLRERQEAGAAEYIDELLAGGEDALNVRTSRERDLYMILWRRATLGFPGVGGARPYRDRYIRPGELKAIYRTNREELKPDEVRLQVLLLPVAAAGGPEEAAALLDDARRRVADGDDFGDLVMELGSESRDTRGILDWTPVPGLRDPRLREFARGAALGELSPTLALPPVGEPSAFLIARIHDRRDETPPAFEERMVQRYLRQAFESNRDRRILEREHATLGRNSFSWLHPGLRRLREVAQGPPLGPGPAGPVVGPPAPPRAGPR